MKMAVFLLKRAAQLIVLALLVAFVTFWLSSLIPGDFFSTHILDSSIRSETVEQLRHKYGLDQPAYIQYLHWLKNLIRLDLGYSMFYQRPVLSVVVDALTKTLWMGIPALVLGFGLGIISPAIRYFIPGDGGQHELCAESLRQIFHGAGPPGRPRRRDLGAGFL